jgi:hypothetical protein
MCRPIEQLLGSNRGSNALPSRAGERGLGTDSRRGTTGLETRRDVARERGGMPAQASRQLSTFDYELVVRDSTGPPRASR